MSIKCTAEGCWRGTKSNPDTTIDDGWIDCDVCEGSGEVERCPECNGKGKTYWKYSDNYLGDKCLFCKDGFVPKERK